MTISTDWKKNITKIDFISLGLTLTMTKLIEAPIKVWKMFSWNEVLKTCHLSLKAGCNERKYLSDVNGCWSVNGREWAGVGKEAVLYMDLSGMFRLSALIASWCELKRLHTALPLKPKSPSSQSGENYGTSCWKHKRP